MLTQIPHTLLPSSPAASARFRPPRSDQFGAVTGHAGLIATEFSYRRMRRSTARMSLRNMSTR